MVSEGERRRTMIDTLKKVIHGRYHMRKKTNMVILDNDTKPIKLFTGRNEAIGFRLDNADHPPFAFFGNNPPKSLTKMCDAIVILATRKELYCTLVEQKTGNSEGYETQLANGKLFCQWLVSLCQEHGYWNHSNISYYGLLVWEPLPIPMKGTTVPLSVKSSPHRLFDKFFDLQHQTEIHVDELITS